MKLDLNQTFQDLISALSFIIDTNLEEKYYHAWRVAIIADHIAKKLTRENKKLFWISLLHDIGAVDLNRNIVFFLKKENRNSQNLLLSHPIIGAQLISTLPVLNDGAKYILDHHEWFNGLGYPRSKTAKSIPLSSQIIRIADTVDILMRFKASNFSQLKKHLITRKNKEVSGQLIDLTIATLKENRLFMRLKNIGSLLEIFEKTKGAQRIKVPYGIDAIGRTLEAISQVIDMKHPFTAGHSLRIARYALAIGLNMKLSHDEITKLRWAGLIHDIGKLSIPRKILDKPTSLTKREFQIVKKHVIYSKDALSMIPTLGELLPLVINHHEYFDGSGYPRGLKKEQIPLGARILSLCDAFDAMTSNRPYRKPLSAELACQEIKKLSGKQFDPEIVRYALPILKNI